MLAGCKLINIDQFENQVNTEIGSVAVIDTAGRAGQLYSRALRRALYTKGQSIMVYDLYSSISVTSSSALSVKGFTSTFKKMTMVISFSLKNRKTNKVLLSDSVTADTTLGSTSSLFGQDQSESHASDRMAKLLAQRVVQRLQLYFLNNPEK